MDSDTVKKSIRAIAEVRHDRAGGPGGQNVNKVNTKATIRLNPANLSGLAEAEQSRLLEALKPRLAGGAELVIASGETRSQKTNLERGFARIENIIAAAVKRPKRRAPTKPSKAVREKRRQSKQRQSRKKAERRTAGPED